MRFSTQTVLAVALAQYAAAQTTHSVTVGEQGLVFNPDTVMAAMGDKVSFEFYPRNHSVVQSSFDAPCNPMSGGIYSGFVPSASGSSSTFFTITITSTDPIWLYCSQVGHCSEGMAMVINPPSSGNTLAAYKSAASSAKASSPTTGPQGGVLGAEGASASGSASASLASTASTASTASEMSTMSTGSMASTMSTGSTASTASTGSTATATGTAATTMSGTVSGSVVATATKAIATAAAGKVAGGMGVWGGLAGVVGLVFGGLLM